MVIYLLLVFGAVHVSRNKHCADVAETHARYLSACLDLFLAFVFDALDSSIYVSQDFFSGAFEDCDKMKILADITGTEVRGNYLKVSFELNS